MSKYKPVKKKYYEIQREERLGEKNINNQGEIMTITKYNGHADMEVTFEDGTIIKCLYYGFQHGTIQNPNHKPYLGETNINYQGTEMKVIDSINSRDITIEFQDEYKAIVKTTYFDFKKGKIKNPCLPGKYGEVRGNKYPTKINGKHLKEYETWRGLFNRVYNTEKARNITYSDVTICKDWYYYPNFYEWLHKQPNFELWKNNKDWAIDKDILSNIGKKIYSPDTCCLVPRFVNDAVRIFHKTDGMPNGVCKNGDGYSVRHVISGKTYFNNIEDALYAYYEYKINKISKAADEAYTKNLITEKCYEGLKTYINF